MNPTTGLRLPDKEGWWARVGEGGEPRDRARWFYVETFDDGTPPSIFLPDIADFVPASRFSVPLTRWYGPVALPSEEA